MECPHCGAVRNMAFLLQDMVSKLSSAVKMAACSTNALMSLSSEQCCAKSLKPSSHRLITLESAQTSLSLAHHYKINLCIPVELSPATSCL